MPKHSNAAPLTDLGMETSFADYIDSIRRAVDTVGIDHAAIGTDMDANFKPVLLSYETGA